MKNLVITILLSSLYNILYSQDVIFTDRPNTTDAISLISPGTFQIELGYFRSNKEVDTEEFTNTTSPNISIKYGLTDWLELRLLTNYQTSKQSGVINSKVNGLTPITFSPKFGMTQQNGWKPKISLATSFTFPNVGEEAFQNNDLNFGTRLLLENIINDKFSWAHGFGPDIGDSSETSWGYSSVVGYVLSAKASVFAEIYGTISDAPDTYYFDLGLGYIITNDLTIDFMIGSGLNNAADDYFISFGGAWKMSKN